MKFLNRDEASHLSLTEAREKAVFYAQGLQQSAHHIQALEKAVADLTKALAEAKQEKLFTQEVLDYLRTQTFGKSSERRTRDADSVYIVVCPRVYKTLNNPYSILCGN
jgi:uncharacterized protein (DUF111 family)